MNEYELLYVIHPRLSADDAPAVAERVSSLITDGGGEVLRTDPWGRRRLAYPIQHELEGTYVYSTFRLPAAGIAALEASLVIAQDVIRHLVVKGVLTEPGTPPPEDMAMRTSRPAAVRAPEASADAPPAEAPTADAPPTEAPAADAPPTEAPTADAPAADAPAADEPETAEAEPAASAETVAEELPAAEEVSEPAPATAPATAGTE